MNAQHRREYLCRFQPAQVLTRFVNDPAEDLGDRARHALGDRAACVESVTVPQETLCAELPDQALARLGASRDQKNLLVRVVFRYLERSMPAAEANALRDRVYAALHRDVYSREDKAVAGIHRG